MYCAFLPRAAFFHQGVRRDVLCKFGRLCLVVAPPELLGPSHNKKIAFLIFELAGLRLVLGPGIASLDDICRGSCRLEGCGPRGVVPRSSQILCCMHGMLRYLLARCGLISFRKQRSSLDVIIIRTLSDPRSCDALEQHPW